MSDRRLKDLIRFYSILNQLEKAIGAARALADCRGRMKEPSRGVYFFRETGENRFRYGRGAPPAAGRNASHRDLLPSEVNIGRPSVLAAAG
jgi:hypothetical protein